MPNLTENFDQLKMSSDIQSSDHSPIEWVEKTEPNKIKKILPKKTIKISTEKIQLQSKVLKN